MSPTPYIEHGQELAGRRERLSREMESLRVRIAQIDRELAQRAQFAADVQRQGDTQ